jgi:hypothetical protein
MRGFALGLQFNPSSPFLANDENEGKLEMLLTKLGAAPVLVEAGFDALGAYQADLNEANDIMKDIYDFTDAQIAGW